VDSFSTAGFNKANSTKKKKKLSVNVFSYIYIYKKNTSYFVEGGYLTYELNALT